MRTYVIAAWANVGINVRARSQVTSAGLPWIDHIDSCFQKILNVPRGQGGAAGPADGCDLSVEPLDRQTGAITTGHDQRVMDCCLGVKRQDVIAECGKDLVGRRLQVILAAPVSQALKAVPISATVIAVVYSSSAACEITQSRTSSDGDGRISSDATLVSTTIINGDLPPAPAPSGKEGLVRRRQAHRSDEGPPRTGLPPRLARSLRPLREARPPARLWKRTLIGHDRSTRRAARRRPLSRYGLRTIFGSAVADRRLEPAGGANEVGEPNGEPTTTGIRRRQATPSHSRGWQMPCPATSSDCAAGLAVGRCLSLTGTTLAGWRSLVSCPVPWRPSMINGTRPRFAC
jgi:hypothetical protein